MRKHITRNIIIYLFSFICILPFFIMVVYSFRGNNGSFSLSQYGRLLFQTEDFYIGFWNSVIYTFVIIGINIPISLLGAYGFSRFNFKGKGVVYWLYIVLMMMPFQATIVPQYLTLKMLNIIHTPIAVVLPNIFSTFGTFLMTQYMRGLDKEIFYAGIIDGLSEFRLFLKIAAPMCRQIIFALTVLLFINYWSMVEQPLVFISDVLHMPLSVTLNKSGVFNRTFYATGVVFSILPILVYQFSYSDLIKGINLSVVSGNSINLLTQSSDEGSYYIQKRKIRKLIVGFMITMAFLTLVTQKITYIMRPTVEVVQTKKSDLKSDPNNIMSESLGYHDKVLPDICVHRRGSDGYVYVVAEENSSRNRKQVMKISVSIEATNGIETAVSGAIPQDVDIIKWSTKPVHEGMFINLAGKRGMDYDR